MTYQEEKMKPKVRCLEQKTVSTPCYVLGPFTIEGQYAKGDFNIPLATAETPVILAVNRGRKLIQEIGGVFPCVPRNYMTRAPVFQAKDHKSGMLFMWYIQDNISKLASIAISTTSYGRFEGYNLIMSSDNLIHFRLNMNCGDAAGHNMLTKAAWAVVNYLMSLTEFQEKIRFVSLSGNYCSDKKPATINLLYGRGKRVFVIGFVPNDVLQRILGVDARDILDLYRIKLVSASKTAGIIGKGNCHHANIIAAIFLATGQDIGNVVEGSMGLTAAHISEDGSLVFRVDIPCLICGTVGGGTSLPYARENLEMMGCYGGAESPGDNANKLAEIIGAAVWAGELSTLAELTAKRTENFIRSHLLYERGS